MTRPVVGFIGLGIMGRPMALNIRNAGYELHVYARRAESMQPKVDPAVKTEKHRV